MLAMSVSLTVLAPAGLLPQPRAGAAAAAPVLASRRMADGVEILEHGRDALLQAPQYAIAPTPLAVMGGAAGDPAFDLTHMWSAVLLSDGRVATWSGIGSKLLLFRADGTAQRTIGRQGSGPGEFMNATNLRSVAGDTLMLVDGANHRINWILPDRGVVAERSLKERFNRGFWTLAGVLPHGRIVVWNQSNAIGEPDRIVRSSAPIATLSAGDGSFQDIGSVPGQELAMFETRFRGRPRVASLPLRLGLGANVVVWDTLIAAATSARAQIDVRGADGRVVRQVSLPLLRRAVTNAMRSAVIDRELARLRGPLSEGMIDPAESERLAREAPFADSLPPFTDLFVSPDKTLWVVDAFAPGDTAWGAVGIRRDGAIVARVRGAGTAIPMAFGNDRVVLRREDADGVVSLAVHRLVRR